jgi:PAS domain S-box-containing protein
MTKTLPVTSMKQEDADLKKEVGKLREKVRELEETLDAIRSGEVDAIVVSKDDVQQVYTLKGADHPYQSLVENIREGVLTLSRTGMILYANKQFAEMVKLPPNKIPGTSILDHICPEYHVVVKTALKGIVKKTYRINIRIRQETGFLPALISMNPLSSDKDTKVSVVVADRREDEEKIWLQARMLDAVGEAVIATDTDQRIIYWNAAATKTYGWTAKEAIGRALAGVAAPEIPKEETERIVAQLANGDTWNGEYFVRHYDGHVFPIYATNAPVFDNSRKLIAVIRTSHDISEQKQRDAALRDNGQSLLRAHVLLEAVTKGTSVLIAAQDQDFRYIFFNQTYKEEIRRITGKDLTLGASMIELFAEIPEEQKRTVNEWSKVLHGEKVNETIKFADPGGENIRIYNVLHTPLRDNNGSIVAAGEVAYDVTEQKQVEETLRETKEYLDNLFNHANAPIIVWDPQFRITRFNQAFEHLTGRKAKEVIGLPVYTLLPGKCQAESMDLIMKTTLDGEQWISTEIPILHKKGDIRTVLWNSASIFGSDGKTIISTIAQGQDITDRKRIEAEDRLRAVGYAKINETLNEEIRQRKSADTMLKKTLSLLHASLESTADAIYVVDLEGKISSYNGNFMTLWDIPPAVLASGQNETVIQHILPQLTYPEEFSASLKEIRSRTACERFDVIECKNGKIIEHYSKPQKIGHRVVGRVWSFRDITDRRHAEEKLIASLAEKEVLLREIHHRVKNNLQLISSLLDMTRMNTHDEPANSILTDMMLKIQTMAQIHARLCQSKQFGKISLITQIQDQVALFSGIYSHNGREISCEIHSNEVVLPLDLAVPCGLAMNEILSNAYKHAFNGQKNCTIRISVSQENGHIQITIRDNGTGIPAYIDFDRTGSLGISLIRTLVQHQLKGTVTHKIQDGTEISIKFPALTEGGNNVW